LNSEIGHFYAIGTGPGDPELLTLKAVNILKRVKWVYSMETPGEKSRALEISEPYIKNGKIVINPYPEGKEARKIFWDKLAGEICQKLCGNEDVGFLTGGDPQLYSTAQSILWRLKKEIPQSHIKTIPGVTSYNAAAALVSLPLLENNEKMAVILVKKEVLPLKPIFQTFDTVVLFGVANCLDELIDLLDEEGLLSNSFFAAKVGLPDEFITFDLKSLKGQKERYTSMIIVKKANLY